MDKIVFIVEDTKSAQYRYRVQNVVNIIGNNKGFRAEIVLRTEIEKVNLGDVSLVVILRQTAKDNTVLNFIKRVREKNIKIVFDLDDLIFNYRDLVILMKSTNSKNLPYWLGYFWGIRRIAKRVDGFTCTNDFLAGKLKQSFNKPVRVIRNSLNKEQVEVSEKWVKKKNDRRKTENAIGKPKNFNIGYFSGSPTHMKDFRLIEKDLIKFLDNHDDAVLKVVGYMDFSNEMKRMIERGRVEIVGMVDYLRLQGLISKVDVNIAPLVINDFTNCKSELKFFEAAAVETTTIASPTFTFKNAITDGVNGFLAQPGEWYDKLEYLYNHPEENRKIAKKAREYVLKKYYGKEFLEEVEEAYGYFAK